MRTRSQHYLELAEKLVSEVAGKYPAGSQERKTYGGLCHNFPILVLTCGLCQAVAFSLDKGAADSSRGKAHGVLLDHVAAVLGCDRMNLVQRIRSADVAQYMMDTRRVLGAWSYFKRFAVSVLKVENNEDAGE